MAAFEPVLHARRSAVSQYRVIMSSASLLVIILDDRAESWLRDNSSFLHDWQDMQLILALARRMDWFHEAMQRSLEPNGIAPLTRAQSIVISSIAAREHRAIDIARSLGVSRQAISQTLTELEKRGAITLEIDPSDRRSRIARFREPFEENGNICAEIFAALEEELKLRIGKRRVRSLHDALNADWGDPPTVADRRPANYFPPAEEG